MRSDLYPEQAVGPTCELDGSNSKPNVRVRFSAAATVRVTFPRAATLLARGSIYVLPFPWTVRMSERANIRVRWSRSQHRIITQPGAGVDSYIWG